MTSSYTHTLCPPWTHPPPKQSDAQRAFDAAQGQPAAGEGTPGDHFPYLKPFQMLHIPTLREYLREEFRSLEAPGVLQTFAYDFERVVDDFVFICFFVGNDFLPHLPSLDIRDGALDFLLNVYKRVLPALGEYLTTPGGGVNLEKVDVILAEVGRVEDEVFRRRFAGEAKHRARLEQRIKQLERRAGGTIQQLQDKMVPEHVVALGQAAAAAQSAREDAARERARREAEQAAEPAKQKAEVNKKNMDVAKALRMSLRKGTKALKRERSQSSTSLDGDESSASVGSRSTTPTPTSGGAGEEGAAGALVKAEAEPPGTEAAAANGGGGGAQIPKRIKLEAVETTAERRSARLASTDGRVKVELSTEVSVTRGLANGDGANVEGAGSGVDAGEEEEEEDLEDEEEQEVKEELEKVVHAVAVVLPELEGTELAAAQKELAERVKAKQEAKLETLRQEIEDTIRYHEAGWKERYYADKLKKHNVEKGGGKAHMCRTYIEGLCWVFQYYYRGCQAWGWFYPFHYAPFASDLVNIDQHEVAFEMGTPLRPLEQLMAVLPPESADALPLPLARLMTAEDSPIKNFYPREVEVDPNGKAMPWLWVTLLPFIDEARLLEAIRAAEAELSPGERKRNELGGSLLCLHEYHPSFRAVADVAGEGAAADASKVLNAASHDGFAGTLATPPPEARLALGALIPAPRNPPYALQDVEDNRALVAAFELPPQSTPHASVLLPGLAYPPPRLTPRDLMPRRPPRLGRGLNIADLGMQFGFTEMHARQRMIMHNMPRGPGSGHGMMMAASHEQHYYSQQQQQQQPPRHGPPYGMGYLAGGMDAMSVGPTGNRSWGSLEPGINQMKHPGRGALPPPLMVGYGPRGPGGPMALPPPRLLVPPGMQSQAPPPRPPMPPLPPGPPPLMPWLGTAARGGPPPSLYPPPPMMGGAPYGGGGGGGPRPPGGLNQHLLNSLRQNVHQAVLQRNQEGTGGGQHRHGQGGVGRLQPPHGHGGHGGGGGGGGGYRR